MDLQVRWRAGAPRHVPGDCWCRRRTRCRAGAKTKRCIDCGDTKPLAAFYKHPSSQDGRQSRCKPCDNRRRAGRVSDREGNRPSPVYAVRLPNGDVVLRRRADASTKGGA